MALTKSHEGLRSKVEVKVMWYQESLSLLERRADGRSEGRHGSPHVFPHTFNEKYVYFPYFGVENSCGSVKTAWKFFSLKWKTAYYSWSEYVCPFTRVARPFSAQSSQPGTNPRHPPPDFFYDIIFFSEATHIESTITIMVLFIEHVT